MSRRRSNPKNKGLTPATWLSLGKFARAVKREIRSYVGEWVRDEVDESDPGAFGGEVYDDVEYVDFGVHFSSRRPHHNPTNSDQDGCPPYFERSEPQESRSDYEAQQAVRDRMGDSRVGA